MFTQVASVAGLVYTNGNVAQFGCTPWSPVDDLVTYELTTEGVTVYFPLTHIFCGEFHGIKATGFHSEAASQSDAQTPSASRLGLTKAEIYNAARLEYIPVNYKTFFDSSLTVKGLSNCISTWAAECYNNNINYSGDCMHLTNIPYLSSGIQVFFYKRGLPGAVTLTLRTAYPVIFSKTDCTTCESPQACNLWQ